MLPGSEASTEEKNERAQAAYNTDILAAWIDGLFGNSSWRAVSLDGKTLCGTAKKKKTPGVRLLAAYRRRAAPPRPES
jgi:hypothetical protein